MTFVKNARGQIRVNIEQESPVIKPITNLLTNPGFEVWQRGAGPFAPAPGTPLYCADRWSVQSPGSGLDTIQADREGTTKRSDSTYGIKISYTASTGGSFLEQRLYMSDGYYFLRGKPIHASIWVKCTTAASNTVMLRLSSDGTGSTTLGTYSQNTTDWQRIQAGPYTVPTDATYIRVFPTFWASDTFYLDNACLAQSDQNVDYIPLIPAEEWARCLRYYEVHGAAGSTGPACHYASSHATSYVLGQGIPFVERKVIAPTLTKAGTWAVGVIGQPSVSGSTEMGYLIYGTSTGAGNAYFYPDSTDDMVTAEANPT